VSEPLTALHGKTFVEWRSELEAQTDRGAAIIGVAFLEARLEEAIRTRLVGVGEPTDLLFRGDAPLATLKAKIDLGFALGLFGSKVHRDLNLLRKIRNKFAHNYTLVSFESADIQSQCSEFWLAANIQGAPEPNNARGRFVKTLLLAFHLLMTEMKDNAPQLNQPKFLPW
jgi:hypothetical protein